MVPASRGCTTEATPSTKKMLKRLLPMTLPRAIAVSPFLAAMTEVMSSGNDVPIATMVTATTDSLMPIDVAMPEAPLTNNSPPKINTASPTRKISADFQIGKSFISTLPC